MKENIVKYIKNAHIENDDKKSTCINITYGADRPFLYGTGVSITSVLLNNRDLNFHFHIFTNYLDEHQLHLFLSWQANTIPALRFMYWMIMN
ncbi:(Glucosyl)lipopolysaccharide-alpha-1,3-D-galactosyltransferase domain protein [Shigella flexneri 1235-66]|nr:(Glucosyl)lipopolysaccharide-alpha-1,3-D-galactosyltransferase domain protein [Shigella flexneri 1235-66]